uniref:Uncharacterized protein n=1 Tax=Anguilla anguilla TaxID=7936 RepID=A0A0E9U987_ANGAN
MDRQLTNSQWPKQKDWMLWGKTQKADANLLVTVSSDDISVIRAHGLQ